MLRDLVFAFDSDEGQDERIFMHTKQMICTMLGLHVAELFAKYIDSSDDRFYLKTGTADECWRTMCNLAKEEDPNK